MYFNGRDKTVTNKILDCQIKLRKLMRTPVATPENNIFQMLKGTFLLALLTMKYFMKEVIADLGLKNVFNFDSRIEKKRNSDHMELC